MYVDTASDIDDDESTADSNNMTEDDATLFALFKASGLTALLKGEILCHNCLGWGHVAKYKSGKPVCPSAVKRPGDCIDGARFLKLRGNNSGSRPAFSGGHRIAVQGIFWRQAKVRTSASYKRFKLKSK
eukprot:30858-Pleurochrysis_carterae.AAC.1